MDFSDFLLNAFAALFGLAGLVYLVCTMVMSLSIPDVNAKQLSWLTMLSSFAASGLIAYWGLSGIWRLLQDALKPGLVYEGQADQVEVTWVNSSHNGYHLWIFVSGGQSWSVPSPPTHLKTNIRVGTTVRLRYRAGTRSVTDIWVLNTRR